MKRVITLAVALGFLSSLAGCLIRTNHHTSGKAVKRCGPAYHLEHGRCVHNGKAKGHRDHRN